MKNENLGNRVYLSLRQAKERGVIKYGETFSASVRDVCLGLFGKSVGSGGCYYEVRPDICVWCIPLNNKRNGFTNRLLENNSIVQTAESPELDVNYPKFRLSQREKYRYVFVKHYTRPVSHRFIGIYKLVKRDKDGTILYERVCADGVI